MPSFQKAWDALAQFAASVKQSVPEAMLQIEESESRLGISLVFPPQASEPAALAEAAAPARGRPLSSASALTEEAIAALIARRPGISREEILAEVKRRQPGVNAGTLSTRLAALVKKDKIRLEGAGYHPVPADESRAAA